jgi:RNA polymerase sigma-70 factor (ECF subfamily)
LGQNARDALEMHYRGRMRLAAIGERLRRSEGAIKLLMFRARQALKNCINSKVGCKLEGDNHQANRLH